MSTAQVAANKAVLSRLHDAVNSGDAQIIAKTIDEVVRNSRLASHSGEQLAWSLRMCDYASPFGSSVTSCGCPLLTRYSRRRSRAAL